ncbi:hypothetical protein FRC06_010123 [Ceratobasidium sp. 370]|nr:hypothetical protein FRC06_010123 [Ceratobasidium sp. 370]
MSTDKPSGPATGGTPHGSTPPRRSPGVTIEEIEDEEQRPSPPRHFPSPTVEEVEDEDMLDPAELGPHPKAIPTRPSLFPEPYPDPTAGVAFYFYQVSKDSPPLYDTKLAEAATFKEAEWLASLPIGDKKRSTYFELPRNRCWYWKNNREFYEEIDRLPHGPRWYRRTIRIPADQGEIIVHLWMRDVIELVQHLISDRRFMEHMRFAPERHYTSAERRCRIFGQMWSSGWWWRMQGLLGKHATVAPVIISTDKTHLTNFSGTKKAWPIYMTIGNISKDIRRKPSERATLLLGYIPVHSLSGISHKPTRQKRAWQLFHTCMELILEPLKTVSESGVEMACADGGVQRVHPILAAYVADFPEQALVACVRESRCPICLAPKEHLGNLSKKYKKRQKRQTLDALEDHWAGYSTTAVDLGVRLTRPFWADLPYVEIASCLTPDLLHQLNKGVFGEHIVNWCTAILGEAEVDRCVKGMPRFPNLRHFSQGISPLSQWTGKEAKALGSIFVPMMAGCKEGEAVAAARGIVDFMFQAHMPELSDDDLDAMERSLADFHDAKDIFVDATKKGLLPDEGRFNDIPKIHMLSHYVRAIRELGTPDGYNTEATERLHIDYVKLAWDSTNHGASALEQMATYLQREEALALLRAHLYETGQLEDEKGKKGVAEGQGDGDEEEDTFEGGDNHDRGEDEWYPMPSVSIAKRPSLGSRTGTHLIRTHGASNLVSATMDYLKTVTRDSTALALTENSKFKVWTRFKLRHTMIPFSPAIEPPVEPVRATPQSIDDEGTMVRFGAFDVVLFTPDDSNDMDGLHRESIPANLSTQWANLMLLGFQAGRVRAIFKLPNHLMEVCSEHLAYVELFRPFSAGMTHPAGLYTTGFMRRNHERCAAVMPISRIQMSCHLAPRYHLLDPDQAISSGTDLLSIHDSFYFNKYASHFHFGAMRYWQKQRDRSWYVPHISIIVLVS